jgi:signal transduction histidine kinase
VRISVMDSGSGVSIEHKSKLFQPYFTTKDTGTEQRGFGLGLTITKRIIDLHQGSIQVTANNPCGSIFTIDLPIM